MSRPKYQPGPTDVAALRLGDDESEADTRHEAVEQVVGHLERRQGEVTSVPVSVLRDIAFEADGGETAATAQEAWEGYVRPALAALDTVGSPVPGRYRYSGPSERVENPDRLAEPVTKQAMDVQPEDDPLLAALSGEADPEQAALSSEDRAELERCELVAEMLDLPIEEVRRRRIEDSDSDAPAASPSDAGSPTDRNADAAAALGTIDRGPQPTPTERTEQDGPQDPETVAERVRQGDAGSQARIEREARSSTESDRGEDAALSSSSSSSPSETETNSGTAETTRSAGLCAVCGEREAEVDAPGVHSTRFDADDRLCSECFQSVALGVERTDTLDSR